MAGEGERGPRTPAPRDGHRRATNEERRGHKTESRRGSEGTRQRAVTAQVKNPPGNRPPSFVSAPSPLRFEPFAH